MSISNVSQFQPWEQFQTHWQDWLLIQGENAQLFVLSCYWNIECHSIFTMCIIYIKCCWLLVKHLTLALFQYAEMVSLPDDLLSVLDEFSDARNEALDEKVDCKKLYDECPSETIVHVMSKIKKLMWMWRDYLHHTKLSAIIDNNNCVNFICKYYRSMIRLCIDVILLLINRTQ